MPSPRPKPSAARKTGKRWSLARPGRKTERRSWNGRSRRVRRGRFVPSPRAFGLRTDVACVSQGNAARHEREEALPRAQARSILADYQQRLDRNEPKSRRELSPMGRQASGGRQATESRASRHDPRVASESPRVKLDELDEIISFAPSSLCLVSFRKRPKTRMK